MQSNMKKPIIGISQGDPNGVGLEVIIKAFEHFMLFDHCIPVLYANPKSFAFCKKSLGLEEPSYVLIKDVSEAKRNNKPLTKENPNI